MEKIKVKLTNDFHGTKTNVVLQPVTEGMFKGLYKISRNVAQRCWRDLCGRSGCVCGDNFGARGGTYLAVVNEDYDRNYIIDINCCNLERD